VDEQARFHTETQVGADGVFVRRKQQGDHGAPGEVIDKQEEGNESNILKVFGSDCRITLQ
jgi:hypothetical protein